MITLFSFSLSYADMGLILLVALLVGMAKTGIHGTGMAAVPLLALVFGGRASSGVMLPILCFADVFAVIYYHRHTKWSLLIRLFFPAAIGVFLGTFIGGQLDDRVFRTIMAVIILLSLGVMIWQERSADKHVPTGLWFALLMGVLGGFTTMVGNLAGAVMALYLLAMRLPKNEYIGTAAWFFMILNWFKIPFHVVFWKTITWDTFFLDLVTLPVVALGAWLGIVVVRRIPEASYRWFIIGTTALAALFMVM